MPSPSFTALYERLQTTPIRGCPGRHLVHDAERCTVEELVGSSLPIMRFASSHARDPILVALIIGGGVISYEKLDGTCVHTLCDEAGFARKLAQLGINLNEV